MGVKAAIAGILAAVVLAIGAALVLDSGVQRTADQAYRTTGARP
jgi:hypothetical protein